jgi:hypothetical protein
MNYNYTEIIPHCRKLARDIPTESIQTACNNFRYLREAQDDLKKLLSQVTELVDVARQVQLPLMFKEDGITSISVDGIRYTISHTVRASTAAGKRDEAFQWLRDNELGALITETVNASTLSAEARRQMEAGEALPENLFNVALVPNVSATKV